MYSKEVVERALELSNNGYSTYQVADMITEEIWKPITAATIQNFIKREKWLTELNESVKTQKLYDINDWFYIFYKTEKDELWDIETKPFPVAISIVDQIFKDYSKHWNNFTAEQIIQRYDLKPETRHLIKSRLRLYKDSNIVSPYTLENIPKEELEDYLEWKIDETIQDKYKNIFVKKDKAIKRREFIKYSNFFHSQTELLENVKNAISNYEPRKLEKISLPKIKNNNTIDIAFSDIHIGKKWTKEVLERLQIMVDYIKSRPEKNINLLFLWDLAESLVEWWIHPWQVEEQEMNWFDLMMFIVNTFEELLIELYKCWKNVKFMWIPWNHWRLAKDHNQDQARTWGLIIYEMIKRWLSNYKIDIEYYRTKTTTLYLENFNIVINHWDEWFDKKAQSNAEKILWDNVDKNGKYNIIAYWDKHNTKISEWRWYTSIWLPALAWAGSYDTRLWLYSESWFVVIEKNNKGTADLLVKRL